MNFDRLAPHYDWLEAVTAGRLLQRARTALLDELAGCRSLLSLGEGHGRFAAACLARFPDAHLTCVDASSAMITRARRRLGARGAAVEWKQADARRWTPPAMKYDAVITCFFLDCFAPSQLAEVIDRAQSLASRNACWLVVDFALPTQGVSGWRARAMHRIMYAFFRAFADLEARRLTPPDALLALHGFKLQQRREFEWGLLRADLWKREAQA